MTLSLEIHPDAARILKHTVKDISRFALESVEEHSRLLAEKSPGVLKDAPESAVTLVNLNGFPRVCVKEFRWRGWVHALKGLFRPTQGLRAFRNGRRLRRVGIGVASPLALLRKRYFGLICSEWIIMEAIPDALELDRYLLKRTDLGWAPGEKRGLARLFGRFIGSLHSHGIFHSDLKTCNVLVSEDSSRSAAATEPVMSEANTSDPPRKTIRFSLLDYDDVRFCGELSDRRRVKNLIQIFLSTPASIGASYRLTFLGEYALHAGLDTKKRRKIARDVLEAARSRDILYVGFDGDVIERWK